MTEQQEVLIATGEAKLLSIDFDSVIYCTREGEERSIELERCRLNYFERFLKGTTKTTAGRNPETGQRDTAPFLLEECRYVGFRSIQGNKSAKPSKVTLCVHGPESSFGDVCFVFPSAQLAYDLLLNDLHRLHRATSDSE